jgi:hypothetical protein
MATLKGEVKPSSFSRCLLRYPFSGGGVCQKEFGITIPRQQVESHDPTKANGKGLAKKWVEMFNETRERFQAEIAEIPIANKAYRLRVLQRMSVTAENMKNIGMTAQLLEQAAKEVGDVYTNKQKVEQNVIATHNVMPVPSCDNVDEWEAARRNNKMRFLVDELQGCMEASTGSQSLSLSCPCNEILYEGTRGPGKTAAQLARFRRNVGVGYGSFWRGVIFDTEYKNLADIITQSKRMYNLFGDGANFLRSASELRWVWPTGEELLFRFGSEGDDYWNFTGRSSRLSGLTS